MGISAMELAVVIRCGLGDGVGFARQWTRKSKSSCISWNSKRRRSRAGHEYTHGRLLRMYTWLPSTSRHVIINQLTLKG